MKKIFYLVLSILVLSCSNSNNFTLHGNIKGLKKGTVYLLRIQDTTFITLDSVVINGDPNFVLGCKIDEPEVLFVKLDKHSNVENFVEFFATEGISSLSSSLKNFAFDAKVTGSEQQKFYNEYLDMMESYENKNLELTEHYLMAQLKKDSIALDSLQTSFDRYLKSKYRYSLNYAVNHGNSEVAPYIGLAGMPDATTKALDTLYNSLESQIKDSKYGIMLKKEIEKRKVQ